MSFQVWECSPYRKYIIIYQKVKNDFACVINCTCRLTCVCACACACDCTLLRKQCACLWKCWFHDFSVHWWSVTHERFQVFCIFMITKWAPCEPFSEWSYFIYLLLSDYWNYTFCPHMLTVIYFPHNQFASVMFVG